jgi:uncharacterized protein (TIGR03435 family)
MLEPGVLGILRPVLLVPAGIEDRLTDTQMAAVLTHELCHIKRRDNLMAAIHMSIQAILWFHPLLWWIGARLVDERERACDDEVIRLGNDREAYAHGILAVCRFYLKSSHPCASGVSSSNLKLRIEQIVSFRQRRLSKVMAGGLVALACAAVSAPILIGMVHAVGLPVQIPLPDLAFEVASMKRNLSGDSQPYSSRRYPGGRYTATNMTLHDLILGAYGLPKYLVSGGPSWWDTERYDIEAKAPAGVVSDGPIDSTSVRQFEAMQQKLLAERFNLRIHRETKVAPIYTMVVAKGGLKMQPSPSRDCTQVEEYCHGVLGGPRLLHGHAMGIAEIAEMLGRFYLDRPVRDKTGLDGLYDFELHWTPESMRGKAEEERPQDVQRREPGVIDQFGPDLITALQEQLGLTLQVQRGPVESIVIDHVEKLVQNEVNLVDTQHAEATQPIQIASTAPVFSRPSTAARQTVKFDAASVKPNLSGSTKADAACRGTNGVWETARAVGQTPLGRCVFRNTRLIGVIAVAYEIQIGAVDKGAPLIVNSGPGWIDSERFDIEATSDPPATEAQLHLMLQALLSERFKLVVHRVTRQMSGFALSQAPTGAKLREAANHDSLQTTTAVQTIGTDKRAFSVATMADLADYLSAFFASPVVDETGLNARYDFDVKFQLRDVTFADGRPDRLSMINVMQAGLRDLGLRLEPREVPVAVTVIDHAERLQ